MDINRVLKYTKQVKAKFIKNRKILSDKRLGTAGKEKMLDHLHFSVHNLHHKYSPHSSPVIKKLKFIVTKKNLPSVLQKVLNRRLRVFWGIWSSASASKSLSQITKSSSYYLKNSPKIKLIRTKTLNTTRNKTTSNTSDGRNAVKKLESTLFLVKSIQKPGIYIMEKAFQMIKKRASFYFLKNSLTNILKTRLEATLKAVKVYSQLNSCLKITKVDPISIQPSPKLGKNCLVTKEISLNLAPVRFTYSPLTIFNKNFTLTNDKFSDSSHSIHLPNMSSAESLYMSFNKDEMFSHIQSLNEEEDFNYGKEDMVEYEEKEPEIVIWDDRLNNKSIRERYAVLSSRETVFDNPFLAESNEGSVNLICRKFEEKFVDVSYKDYEENFSDFGGSLQSNTTSSKNSKSEKRLKEIVIRSLRSNLRAVKCVYKGIELINKTVIGKIQEVFNLL